MKSIDYIRQRFKSSWNDPFLISSQGNTYTYGLTATSASIINSRLYSIGLKEKESIAVIAENSVELALLYIALMVNGNRVIPIHPLWSESSSRFILSNSKVSHCIYSSKMESKLERIDVKVELIALDSLIDLDNIENDLSRDVIIDEFRNVSDDDELITIYTSGTTSTPKGVVHSYASLLNNGNIFSKMVGVNKDSRFYNNLAMTYLGGYYNLLMLPFINGASVVIDDSFNASSIFNYWDNIIKYKVNI